MFVRKMRKVILKEGKTGEEWEEMEEMVRVVLRAMETELETDRKRIVG